MALKRAVKTDSKLRMAILGPAGSGKTFTALKLATVLAQGKPIALYDTEHGSAAKYADDFAFDTDNIAAPFHPDKFVAAIKEAAQAGYGVVILDSLSHAWNGEGGLLDIVEMIAKRMKNPNSFAAWKDATPIQNRLTEAIVGADIHIITTMRSKTEYILQANERGVQQPKKVGMAPIQRSEFEYEFDVVMEMDADNVGIITKTRCSALTGGVFTKPGNDVAKILVNWLHGEPDHRNGQTTNGAQPLIAHRNVTQPEPPPPAEVNFYQTDEPTPVSETVADNPFTDQAAGKAATEQLEYGAIADKLTGEAKVFAEWAYKTHSRSRGDASEKQHGYLTKLIDDHAGKDSHRHVLSVLCRRYITSATPCGSDLARALFDSIAPEVAKTDADGNKVKENGKQVYIKNPRFSQEHVDYLKEIAATQAEPAAFF